MNEILWKMPIPQHGAAGKSCCCPTLRAGRDTCTLCLVPPDQARPCQQSYSPPKSAWVLSELCAWHAHTRKDSNTRHQKRHSTHSWQTPQKHTLASNGPQALLLILPGCIMLELTLAHTWGHTTHSKRALQSIAVCHTNHAQPKAPCSAVVQISVADSHLLVRVSKPLLAQPWWSHLQCFWRSAFLTSVLYLTTPPLCTGVRLNMLVYSKAPLRSIESGPGAIGALECAELSNNLTLLVQLKVCTCTYSAVVAV